MSTALATIGNKLSQRFGMGDNTTEVMDILKATAFKGGQVSDAQMTSLMIVADQYGLNPWTREIYAFPDKGGIVPVVGVDGWSRIINEHPQFDGIEFEQNDESCTCIMYRKDRSHPTKVTEWYAECRRDNAQPWKTHPKRMLRHKALIQCARLAFGFVGIYDQDEAERMVEKNMGQAEVIKQEKPALEECSAELFATLETKFKSAIQSGEKTANALIEWASAKTILTDDQKIEIAGWEQQGETYENA